MHTSIKKPKNQFTINHNIFLNPRYYHLFALGSFAFLLAFLASVILTPVSSSSAADPAASTIDISNQYNGRYLSFSAQRNLGLNISAVPEGTISAVTDNLSISTNVGTGYKLSLSVQDPSGTPTNNIYNTADIDKVSNHFSPVSGTIENPSPLTTNTWGFKLATIDSKPDADITWSAVPTDTTVIRETDTAATATTGASTMVNEDAPDSICPKGWKLPTSGNTTDAYGANAPDKSYGKLMYSVLNFASYQETGITGGTYTQEAQQAPLYFPISGLVKNGYIDRGSMAEYLTRAANDDNIETSNKLVLRTYNASNFLPNDRDSKYLGASVRCVLNN